MRTILSHGELRVRDTDPGTESRHLSHFHRVRFVEAGREALDGGAPVEIRALACVRLGADGHARRDPGAASRTFRMLGTDRLPSAEG